MNLFRSICCLFAGRCAGEEPKPTKETMRGEAPVSEGDLGQTEHIGEGRQRADGSYGGRLTSRRRHAPKP
jgi:hypothetical protein